MTEVLINIISLATQPQHRGKGPAPGRTLDSQPAFTHVAAASRCSDPSRDSPCESGVILSSISLGHYD